MREEQIHNALIAWLKKEKIPFIRSRMDKRTTTQIGMPDFVCFRDNRACLLEIKAGSNKLSKAQRERIMEFALARCSVRVARSVEEAIGWITFDLGEGEKSQQPVTAESSESKFYIANSNLGQVVVAKDQAGTWGAIRVASEEDVRNFPKRTEAVK